MSIRPWDMSWWEYAAKQGLSTRVGPRAGLIERGPHMYAKQKPVRDYLSEPIDWLSMPLDVLKSRRF